MTDGLVVAAAQYPIDALPDFDGWRDKLAGWVGEAASAGADLLVFPEYAGLELASTLPSGIRDDLQAQLRAMDGLADAYLAHYLVLAARHRVFILAGSLPVLTGRGLRNRAWLVGPDGSAGYQDKLGRTRTEATDWGIEGGETATLFETSFGKVGVLICYDAELPYPARALAEAGADLLLVPSCTDTEAGFHRVRIGCQARALENQLPLVQSATVGEAPWSPALDINIGAAALYGPPETGLSDDGIFAAGPKNLPTWLITTVDFRVFRRIRAAGAVATFADFPARMPPQAAAPVVVKLAP